MTSPRLSASEARILREACSVLGLDLGRERERLLAAYRDEILRWDRRCRLVSRGDQTRLVAVHFVDSLRPLPYLPAGQGTRLMDLGSGAGLPGVVLKIFRPDLKVLLLDSVRKKRVFLLHVTHALGLEGVETLAERSEAIEDLPSYRGVFQTVVTRAAGGFEDILRRSSPFLAPGGLLLTYVPSKAPGGLSVAALPESAARLCASLGMSLPEVAAEREIPGRRGDMVLVRKREAGAP